MKGKVIKYEQDNIDTDVILPGPYLKLHEHAELAEHAMEGLDPDFHSKVKNANIIVTGNNFGCGSSREHAAWSLLDYGFRAIISTSFADIFQNNSLKNGLITIVVNLETHKWLLEHPATTLIVDLDNTQICLENGKVISFPIDSFARYCLLNGVDQLSYLLNHESEISAYENKQQ